MQYYIYKLTKNNKSYYGIANNYESLKDCLIRLGSQFPAHFLLDGEIENIFENSNLQKVIIMYRYYVKYTKCINYFKDDNFLDYISKPTHFKCCCGEILEIEDEHFLNCQK